MKKPVVGVLGTGIYIPEGRMTAKEISEATGGFWAEEAVVEKLGIIEKPMPGPGIVDGSQEMAVKAAKDALKNTGLDPLEIDVIIDMTEEWKEFPLTTSALYVQGEIGAWNAWGIDVQNRCCTTVSAIKMAKDMLVADDKTNYAGNAFAMAGYVAATMFVDSIERMGNVATADFSVEAYIASNETAPFGVPMGGSISYENGQRIGITDLALLQFVIDGETRSFVKALDIQSLADLQALYK